MGELSENGTAAAGSGSNTVEARGEGGSSSAANSVDAEAVERELAAFDLGGHTQSARHLKANKHAAEAISRSDAMKKSRQAAEFAEDEQRMTKEKECYQMNQKTTSHEKMLSAKQRLGQTRDVEQPKSSSCAVL